MMTNYSAVALRYVHDVATGEFVNIGVVVFAPQERYLHARFASNIQRITRLFPGADTSHIRRVLDYLEQRFESLRHDVDGGLPFYSEIKIAEVVTRVLPRDDSSLQWSEEFAGLTPSFEQSLEQLYQRMVNRYTQPIHARSKKENEVASIFLNGLGSLADKLVSKKISNELSSHTFHHAWKNGRWNCYEPVSFDLADSTSMKEKAVRIVGNGLTLADTESHKVYFLLGAPSADHDPEAYRRACSILDKYPTDHELIDEANVEAFAQQVAREIAAHEREI